ncbi:MAG: nitroreductase family protein [Anaerolineae bacterium]|nr:nitroreductase family protein [Anaerolineae bacterium]
MTPIAAVEDINHLFRARYSGRAYDPAREVSSHDLNALFEAARWSPSGGNAQPWRYIVARKEDGAGYEKLLNLLNEHNREWAQHAPVLVLSAVMTVRVNAQGEKVHNSVALHDLGMANMALSLEAVNRGLMAHLIGGFDKDSARDLLPDDVDPVVMIALGHPGDHAILSDHNQNREKAPRTRKPLDEIVTTL